MEKCAEEIIKCHKKKTNLIPKDAVWKQFEELSVKQNMLPMIYYHLVQHYDAMRASLDHSFERYKKMFKHIMSNYSLRN